MTRYPLDTTSLIDYLTVVTRSVDDFEPFVPVAAY